MANKINYYELSQEADIDLDKIFNYSEQEHGFNQAVKYLSELDDIFNALVLNPETGRKRNEVMTGLYSISEQFHTIFYRIIGNHIRIVRVLHGRKDIPRQFK